jgi:hypothetical protein
VSAQLSNYVLQFQGVVDPTQLGGKRFITAVSATARIWTLNNVNIAACAAACDLDSNCRGIYYRINNDGVTTACNALLDLGSANGLATTTNSFSYAKAVCSTCFITVILNTSADPGASDGHDVLCQHRLDC